MRYGNDRKDDRSGLIVSISMLGLLFLICYVIATEVFAK